MSKNIYTITEYGSFVRDKSVDGYEYLPAKVFDKLETFVLENAEKGSDAADLMGVSVKKNIGRVITAKNYVGVIALDDGSVIEILPKICGEDNELEVKKIFIRMLRALRNSPFKSMQATSINIDKLPIFEIFISMFISECFAVVKKGLKSGYETVEDNLNVCKGKIDFNSQIKNNLVHKEKFYVRYDEFNNNLPENRLIKSTLQYLFRFSAFSKNKTDLKTLLNIFENIDTSANVDADFEKCTKDRNSVQYGNILMWCKVFLKGKSFTSFAGSEVAYALLFPMEVLFESYVATNLSKIINPMEFSVSTQDRGYHLFDNPSKFALRPDIVITRNGDNAKFIMDTKWKLLYDSPSSNYGISQSDMYQMYTYQKKYKAENVTLIYPLSDKINQNTDIIYKSDDNVIVNVKFIDLIDVKESLKKIIEFDKSEKQID